MTDSGILAKDGRTLTVRVPIAIRKRGGRKLVLAPEGTAWSPPRAQTDSTMVRALARAHRWKRLLENGEYASVAELADIENINPSYLCKILRLTLLSPEIIETIMNGRQPKALQLHQLLSPFPLDWGLQRRTIKKA